MFLEEVTGVAVFHLGNGTSVAVHHLGNGTSLKWNIRQGDFLLLHTLYKVTWVMSVGHISLINRVFKLEMPSVIVGFYKNTNIGTCNSV